MFCVLCAVTLHLQYIAGLMAIYPGIYWTVTNVSPEFGSYTTLKWALKKISNTLKRAGCFSVLLKIHSEINWILTAGLKGSSTLWGNLLFWGVSCRARWSDMRVVSQIFPKLSNYSMKASWWMRDFPALTLGRGGNVASLSLSLSLTLTLSHLHIDFQWKYKIPNNFYGGHCACMRPYKTYLIL